LSSALSHTALWQTSALAWLEHTPLSVGLACGVSVGMAVLLASVGVQVCSVSLHQLPPVQSASTLQPPAGSHKRLLLHAPVRHTVAAFAAVHGPRLTA
jgi:hypothetical protein